MNDVVVGNLKKSKNRKTIKLKKIKNEVLMKEHPVKLIKMKIHHQPVKVNRTL